MRLQGFRSSRSSKSNEQTGRKDIGFGTSYDVDQRLMNRNGSFNVKRIGGQGFHLYQDLVEMSWTNFFIIITLGFIMVNSIFALIYLFIGLEELSGIEPHSIQNDFAYAFFFSVQTFTTVGYGSISPQGMFANIIASLDALVGLLAFALATGLFFARFSKPQARFLFSDKAIIAPYKDKTSLQFRIANKRSNRIINLATQVNMTWIEVVNGHKKRRFARLPLEISQITLFPLNWTIVHEINDESPFWGKTEADIKKMDVEIIALVVGYDESYAQTVNASCSYIANEIHWNTKFVKMYHYEEDEALTVLNLEKISEVVRVEKNV